MRLTWVATLLILALAAASPRVTAAFEVTIQNDSTVSGTPSTAAHTLVGGEEAAAWLTTTCSGTLVAVQVYWASQAGSSGPSIETAIRVYDGTTHPNPGATLATVTLPTLLEGVMNEYRFLDPNTNAVPMTVPGWGGAASMGALLLLALGISAGTLRI